MAYIAHLNGKMFFDTELQEESFYLSSAELTLSAGAAGDFTFLIPAEHEFYDAFHPLIDYVDVYCDGLLIFVGRVFSVTEETDTQRLVSCEGLLAVLADSVFRPITWEGTLHGLVNKLLESHNKQVNYEKVLAPGNITVQDTSAYRPFQTYETTISRFRDLVESFGGYLSISKETGYPNSIVDVDLVDVGYVDIGNGIKLSLNWVPDFTEVSNQTIEITSNLISISLTEDRSDIITVMIPIGATEEDGTVVTIDSVNGGRDYIEASATDIAKYGRIVGTYEWEDVHTPSILLTKAQAKLNEILTPRRIIELTVADLAGTDEDVDAFRIGQKITVKSEPHGLDNEQFNCVEQHLNLLHPEQNTLTIGEAQQGYVQTNSKGAITNMIDSRSQQWMPRGETLTTIKSLISMATGNSGGNIRLHDSNGDGKPDELLIMDTANINTAVRLFRWNAAGLGYSSNGYNGDYEIILSMDR